MAQRFDDNNYNDNININNNQIEMVSVRQALAVFIFFNVLRTAHYRYYRNLNASLSALKKEEDVDDDEQQ